MAVRKERKSLMRCYTLGPSGLSEHIHVFIFCEGLVFVMYQFLKGEDCRIYLFTDPPLPWSRVGIQWLDAERSEFASRSFIIITSSEIQSFVKSNNNKSKQQHQSGFLKSGSIKKENKASPVYKWKDPWLKLTLKTTWAG